MINEKVEKVIAVLKAAEKPLAFREIMQKTHLKTLDVGNALSSTKVEGIIFKHRIDGRSYTYSLDSGPRDKIVKHDKKQNDMLRFFYSITENRVLRQAQEPGLVD